MLTTTREYRPVAALSDAQPVKFHVSPAHLHIDINQPYTKLASRLTEVSFHNDKFSLNQIPVVRVTGGSDSDLFWEVTLKPADAADLKAVIIQVVEEAKKL